MKIYFVSLGCDKNLVDSEYMLGLLRDAGHTLTQDESEAEAIVINTCCFIHDAKEESINALLEMAEKDAWEDKIDYISIDHDAGVYAAAGGDYINLLNFLEYRQHTSNGHVYPIEIHSMNAVGCVNMRAIIERNGWEEIR